MKTGSPTLNNQNSGSTQITFAIPLEWYPDPFGGGSTHPVIYPGILLGKYITLNYNNMGPVALYETVVYSDTAIPFPTHIEMPTGYMPATFNRYYRYDAQSETLTEVFPADCGGAGGWMAGSGYGGVIISETDGSAAMGVYGASTNNGGSVFVFSLYDLRSCGATSKWNADAGFDGGFPAGSVTLRSYVASGTLNDVKTYMRQLYLSGAR